VLARELLLRNEPSLNLPPGPCNGTAELTTILEGIGEGFYAVDREWKITRFNSEAVRHFSRGAPEVMGRNLWEVFPGARETPLGQLFLDTMASRQPVKAETPSVVIAGRWLAYRLFPLGEGMGVVFRDITDRKTVEEQRDLLIRELHHRVNNTLATVQAIAAQTFRNTGVDAEARETFDARLLTLSKVHAALTDEDWDNVALHALVASALQPHRDPGRETFSVSGPDMRVRPKSAAALAMAIHELCTNASKYGALSVADGHVTIAWDTAGDRFRLRWEEHGGPPVTPPGRMGFGSVMIERALAAQLEGEVAIDYEATGVVCTIDAPLDAVRNGNAAG
jgi:two-component sensor histidine kinase